MGILQEMPRGPIRTWYEEHDQGEQLERLKMGTSLTDSGHYFDNKTGFFFRPHKVAQEDLGQTCLDIIFPRPTDIHYHKGVVEMVRVLSGSGKVYTFDSYKDHKPKYWMSSNMQPSSITHLTLPRHENATEAYEKLLDDNDVVFYEKNHTVLEADEVHAFIPDKNEHLQIRLICSGILHDDNEHVLKRFDHYIWPFSDHTKK